MSAVFALLCVGWAALSGAATAPAFPSRPTDEFVVPDDDVVFLDAGRGRTMRLQEYEGLERDVTDARFTGTNEGLYAALVLLRYNASAGNGTWVRFDFPDAPEAPVRQLVAFTGCNATDLAYPHISFKMAFAVDVPQAYEVEFANDFNVKYGWAHVIVTAELESNLLLWFDQLVTGDDAAVLFRRAVSVFASESRTFVAELRVMLTVLASAATVAATEATTTGAAAPAAGASAAAGSS